MKITVKSTKQYRNDETYQMNIFIEPFTGIMISQDNSQYNQIGDIMVFYRSGLMHTVRFTSNGYPHVASMTVPLTEFISHLPEREVRFGFDRTNKVVILHINSIWCGVITKDGHLYTPSEWNKIDKHFNDTFVI